MPTPDLPTALAWCGAIAAVGVGVSSLEVLVSWRAFARGGIFAGGLLAQHTFGEEDLLARRTLGWLFTTPALVGLTALRLASAIVLLLPAATIEERGAAAAVAFITGAVLVWRNRYGTDGSDQMTAIVLAGVTVGSLFHASSTTATAAVAFVAAQACLAYFVAGVAKTRSPLWRGGTVIPAVMQTETWGSQPVAAWLASSPARALLASWTVIVAECAFPLVLVAPEPVALALLAWGAAFHVFCAVAMGLNTFFWAFVAAYPAILFLRGLIASGGGL